VTILEALADEALFAHSFPASTWRAWFAFLAALFGLELEGEALDTFRRHTGRAAAPSAAAREAWVVVGRRGGKSRMSALVAVYLACFRDYSKALAPGERATMMVIAADRRQARVVFRYVLGLLEGVPMLAAMIERQTREAIHLANRVTIEVHTASFRTTRGYTVVGAILDEVAYWSVEGSSNPDHEIVNAIRPAMATIPGALLLGISSPYARRGVLWDAYRKHHGKDGDPVLVWVGDTRSMHPSVDESVIAAAYEEDEASAAAEYGAEFRRDIESYVSREAVDALVVPGRHELPPVSGLGYTAAVDPAGGSGTDSMTLAIAHTEEREGVAVAVLDCVRERRPPFSPESVVTEFCETLGLYGVVEITGDRWGGEFCREPFRKAGIEYALAEKPKSDVYREALPLLNSGRVELLDHPRLVAQLLALERRTARGGRDSIDHGPGAGAHDDVVNSAALALWIASQAASSTYDIDVLIRDFDRDMMADSGAVGVIARANRNRGVGF
jgi:hypothetical protein